MTAKKTTRQKRISGTLRRCRLRKPDPAVRLTTPPRAPAELSAEAKRQWRRVAPLATRLGTLTACDLPALQLLAETLADVVETKRLLATEGATIAAGSGGRKGHPAARTLAVLRSQARGLLELFGLTPKSRQQLDIPPPPRMDADERFLRDRTPPLDQFIAEVGAARRLDHHRRKMQ